MGGAKASKTDAGKRVEADLLTWPYADLQTGNEMPGRLAALLLMTLSVHKVLPASTFSCPPGVPTFKPLLIFIAGNSADARGLAMTVTRPSSSNHTLPSQAVCDGACTKV